MNKNTRILDLYARLRAGKLINKQEDAIKYNVSEKTIQRDINDIRNYLEEDIICNSIDSDVIYDKEKKAYRLDNIYNIKLTNSEVLAVCKILLDSRAFVKEDMADILKRLISSCVPKDNQEIVDKLIRNEMEHYIELRHKVRYLDTLWKLGQAINKANIIEVDYKRTKGNELVTRRLKPLAIMFSDFYFYFVAFIDDENIRNRFENINDSNPTIYRVDRVQELRILNETYYIPYGSRFEEGEFRKKIQFMYGGKLTKIKFEYYGADVNPILDRLPTAKVDSVKDGVYTITAEVFGNGLEMWLGTQGKNVKVLEKK